MQTFLKLFKAILIINRENLEKSAHQQLKRDLDPRESPSESKGKAIPVAPQIKEKLAAGQTRDKRR